MRTTAIRPRATIAALGSMLLAMALFFTPGVASADGHVTPPKTDKVSGKQDKPAVKAGSKDGKSGAAKGTSKLVSVKANGAPKGAAAKANGASALAGYVSGVDFTAPYNYCYRNLVYTPVKNTTSATKYYQVRVYNQGSYRDYYGSVSSGGSISYPTFYGVDGTYYAYLYVWNGSYYEYDEYWASNNTCRVTVERTYNTGGWVQLKIQNTGTAYATQVSRELAPYLGNEYPPYTGGPKYDYPAAGGAAIYRWFYVGYSPYAVISHTADSWNYPYQFAGDH